MLVRWCGRLLLVIVAVSAIDTRLNAQASPGEAQEIEIVTAPVELDGATLLRVRGASSFPAETRARFIRDQLRTVAADSTISVDSFRTVNDGGVTRILAGDASVMTVTDADASFEQIGRDQLAEVHRARMRQAVIDYRASRSSTALTRAVVACVVASVILIAAVLGLRWFWRRLDAALIRRVRPQIEAVEAKSFEVMRAEQIWNAVRTAFFGLRALVFLTVVAVYAQFVLAQLPWSRGLSQDLFMFSLGQLAVIGRGLVSNIPSLVFLAVLFVVVRLALKFIGLFFNAVGRGAVTLENFDADWAEPTYKIVRFAIVAFALVVAYPYIPGSDTAAFQGISLFIGIVFSLGSSSAISNIIAGYMVTYRRALKVGDRVKIGDAFGDVIQVGLQATYLRSPKNEEIIMPNSQILAGEVVNYSSLSHGDAGLILHTEVGIGYDTPWRQVEAMLLAAAERTGGVSTEPEPFVLQKRLGDFAVTYELNVSSKNVKAMARIYTDLHRNIQDVFNEYGVQIMTPAYEGDPAEPKIVPPEQRFGAGAQSVARHDGSRSVEPVRAAHPLKAKAGVVDRPE